MTDVDEMLAFYRTPASMTDLAGQPPELLEGLPSDPAGVARVVQGLVVHDEWGFLYGLDLPPERRFGEIRTRPAADMVELIHGLCPRPLAVARPPEQRMVGNCRHFATLTCALLRHHGVPSRTRNGFATYLAADEYVDHWVTEYWSDDERGWRRIDAQLDDKQRAALHIGFGDHLTDDAFVTVGDAWQRCRRGDADPDRFGIAGMSGSWFIRNGVVRDLAALNKVELLPWDGWGIIHAGGADDTAEAVADEVADEVAGITVDGDFDSIRRRYTSDERVRVPAEVVDLRFGGTYRVP